MIVDKSESVPVPGVMVVTQSHISGSVSRKHYQLPTYQHCLGCLSLRTRSHHMWDVRRLPACRQSPLSLGMSRLLTRILSLRHSQCSRCRGRQPTEDQSLWPLSAGANSQSYTHRPVYDGGATQGQPLSLSGWGRII